MIHLNINGKEHELAIDPKTPLLWVLRDELGLIGTKFGCGVAQCGACTVHVEGEAIRSCQTLIEDVDGREITTIEHLSKDKIGAALQKSWLDIDVAQCGYCQAGQLMSATALLTENPNPSDQDIDSFMEGNICRCATYTRIRQAIKQAASTLAGDIS